MAYPQEWHVVHQDSLRISGHAHISLAVRWPSWPTVPPGSWATPILHHHILTRFFRCDWGWLKVETILDVTQKKVWVLDTSQLTVLVRCLGFLIWFNIYIYTIYTSHILYIHIKARVTQRKRCVRWGGTLEPKIIGFSGLQKRSDVPKSWECLGALSFWLDFLSKFDAVCRKDVFFCPWKSAFDLFILVLVQVLNLQGVRGSCHNCPSDSGNWWPACKWQ